MSASLTAASGSMARACNCMGGPNCCLRTAHIPTPPIPGTTYIRDPRDIAADFRSLWPKFEAGVRYLQDRVPAIRAEEV